MLKWTFIIYLLSQSADIVTSLIKYHQGCIESTWSNKISPIIFKSGAVVFTFSIKDRKLALVPEIPSIISGTYGTIHNLRTSCH